LQIWEPLRQFFLQGVTFRDIARRSVKNAPYHIHRVPGSHHCSESLLPRLPVVLLGSERANPFALSKPERGRHCSFPRLRLGLGCVRLLDTAERNASLTRRSP
jgi:hypothetical protein